MTGKRALSATDSRDVKKNHKSITLGIKLDELHQFEKGEKLKQISKTLGLATYTAGTYMILKTK